MAEVSEISEEQAREAVAVCDAAMKLLDYDDDDMTGGPPFNEVMDAANANATAAITLREFVRQELSRRDAEQAEAERLLRDLMQVFDAADEERLKEVHERDAEAEKWKSEGDMYGWNFHKGVAAGCTTASIIFFRVKRSMEQQRDLLKALKGGA